MLSACMYYRRHRAAFACSIYCPVHTILVDGRATTRWTGAEGCVGADAGTLATDARASF